MNGAISRNALPATAGSYHNACAILASDPCINMDLATLILHEECLQATKDGVYSCMWHVHGLASVLKRPIISIYPNFSHRSKATPFLSQSSIAAPFLSHNSKAAPFLRHCFKAALHIKNNSKAASNLHHKAFFFK